MSDTPEEDNKDSDSAKVRLAKQRFSAIYLSSPGIISVGISSVRNGPDNAMEYVIWVRVQDEATGKNLPTLFDDVRVIYEVGGCKFYAGGSDR